MRSGNPVLQDKAFQGLPVTGERMTMNGTITRTALLLALAILSGGWTWNTFMTAAAGGNTAAVTTFAQRWAGITAPLYALAEGFALGGISSVLELRYPGIVLQAVMLTVGVLAAMLLLYRSGLIKVTDKFRMGVVAATGAIALLYLVDIGLRAFTSVQIPFIHESGALGIGFSLLVVGLAALNLVLDFDMIERATEQGAPKYMEWYCAFALMVTLVWLYMELLRLLSKTRR
jgi:uncharacterized YccA/Bax inhibitor family protein